MTVSWGLDTVFILDIDPQSDTFGSFGVKWNIRESVVLLWPLKLPGIYMVHIYTYKTFINVK